MLPNSNQSCPNVMIYLIIKKLKDLFSPSKRNILTKYSLFKNYFYFRIFGEISHPDTKKKKKKRLIGTMFCFLLHNKSIDSCNSKNKIFYQFNLPITVHPKLMYE